LWTLLTSSDILYRSAGRLNEGQGDAYGPTFPALNGAKLPWNLSGDDDLTLSGRAETLRLDRGDDAAHGGGGDDQLYGEAGRDDLRRGRPRRLPVRRREPGSPRGRRRRGLAARPSISMARPSDANCAVDEPEAGGAGADAAGAEVGYR